MPRQAGGTFPPRDAGRGVWAPGVEKRPAVRTQMAGAHSGEEERPPVRRERRAGVWRECRAGGVARVRVLALVLRHVAPRSSVGETRHPAPSRHESASGGWTICGMRLAPPGASQSPRESGVNRADQPGGTSSSSTAPSPVRSGSSRVGAGSPCSPRRLIQIVRRPSSVAGTMSWKWLCATWTW